jgi:hypothetical protein
LRAPRVESAGEQDPERSEAPRGHAGT